jgi:hypothetical protein
VKNDDKITNKGLPQTAPWNTLENIPQGIGIIKLIKSYRHFS